MLIAFRHSLFTAAAAAAALSFTLPVLAQSGVEGDCAADADCADGLICAVVGAEGGCTARACAEGDESCDPTPVCEEVELRACVEPRCQVDADCGAGLTCVVPEDGSLPWCEPQACTTDADCGDASLKCHEETYEECSGGDIALPECPPDTDCEVPVPEESTVECTTYTESYCAPLYVGNCETAADCGEGFDCVPDEACWCSGSGGSAGTGEEPSTGVPTAGAGGAASSDGSAEPAAGATDSTGDEDVAPDETCGCEPTGTNSCVLQEILCEDDAACPEGWSCVEQPTAVVDCDPAGSAEECVQPEPAPSRCEPPLWGGDPRYLGEHDSDGVASDGEVVTDPGTPEEGDSTDPVVDDQTAEEEPAVDEEQPSDEDEEPAAEEEEPADEDEPANAAEDAEDDGGCQVALGSRAGGSALGLLLGLVGLGALRRRR